VHCFYYTVEGFWGPETTLSLKNYSPDFGRFKNRLCKKAGECVPQSRGSQLFITARCTLVQSAVMRSHVVCLSVCNVDGLWSHRLEYIRNNFTLVSLGCSLSCRLKHHGSAPRGTPPKFGPKVTPCWFERRRHSIANCGRMVTDSATVTMESL